MDSFVFAPRNAAHCISGQNKWLETRGLLGMYAEDWTKCEKLARRTTASAPHNASVIGDPAENWTGGGNFTRHVCRELNRKRDGGLGSRDTRDGTPSSVVEEYLLGGKSPRTGQVAGNLWRYKSPMKNYSPASC